MPPYFFLLVDALVAQFLDSSFIDADEKHVKIFVECGEVDPLEHDTQSAKPPTLALLMFE